MKQGINPAHQRQAEKVKKGLEANTTFESVAREWVALKDWEEVTKTRRLKMLERSVFPHIGPLPIRQISSAQILHVMRTSAEKNGPTVADEAKRTMSGVFEFAIATLRADADPVYPVRRALPPNKTQHKRALSTDEVGKLLRDLQGYERNFLTVSAFRLMWLTLCRPGEAAGAKWCEFDFESGVWTIPPERMKKRTEHVIPLPHQALDLLRAIKGVTGHQVHVFPNRNDPARPMTDHALRMVLRYVNWSKSYSPHATRTTGSTLLNGMGFHPDHIERQLAHADPNGVRRTYNHAIYLRERAAMMQHWADMLDAWQRGSKVIPIRSSAA